MTSRQAVTLGKMHGTVIPDTVFRLIANYYIALSEHAGVCQACFEERRDERPLGSNILEIPVSYSLSKLL